MTDLYRGCMRGRTMYVIPFVMGHLEAEQPDVRRGDHRLGVRRRLDEGDGPHGHPRAAPDGGARRRRTCTSSPRCTRSACRSSRRPGRRRVALQRHEVHRAVPRGADDLVLRLRLRRQRAARQEVLRAAHRQRDGPRRGLARRAHADPQADQPRGRHEVHRRRLPERLRQDQPRDAGADHPGLEGRDPRRRHRLDADRRRRPALRGQPGVRLLRRRPGHQRAHQPQRDAHHRHRQLGVHQRRAHRRRRRLVGGHGEHRPRTPRRGRARTGPRTATSCPATRTAATARRSSSARSWRRSTTTRAASRSTRSCSAAGARPRSRWSPRPATGRTARSWAPRSAPRRPRPPIGQVGVVRRDPMAMLPFIGYNAGDYFNHWITVGKDNDAAKLPRIFYVNWFRRDEDGGFLWPGFGENSRVLKWVVERIEGQAEAVETPIGHVPTPESLDTDGPRHVRGRPSRRRWPSTSRSGRPRSRRSPSGSRSSATTSPPCSGPSSTGSRRASASDPRTARHEGPRPDRVGAPRRRPDRLGYPGRTGVDSPHWGILCRGGEETGDPEQLRARGTAPARDGGDSDLRATRWHTATCAATTTRGCADGELRPALDLLVDIGLLREDAGARPAASRRPGRDPVAGRRTARRAGRRAAHRVGPLGGRLRRARPGLPDLAAGRGGQPDHRDPRAREHQQLHPRRGQRLPAGAAHRAAARPAAGDHAGRGGEP